MFFVITQFVEDNPDHVSYEVHAGPFDHYVDARNAARNQAGDRANMFLVARIDCAFQRPEVPEVRELDVSDLSQKNEV